MNEEVKSPLVNKTVTIFPIKRKGGWLPPDHDGAYLNTGAKVKKTGLLYNNDTRKLVDPLTEEEKAWFYQNGVELGIDEGSLSIHKKKNFWTTFSVDFTKEPVTLNLNDPMDFLRYKYILAQVDIVAPSWQDQTKKGTYRFAVRDYEQEAALTVKRISKEKEVNRYFYRIENDEHKLRALLKMYYYTKDSHRTIAPNASITSLTNDVYDIIGNDLDKVYEIIIDPSFETKFLIYESIDKGVISKPSASKYQIEGEEDILSLTELVKFLEDKKNQHVKAKLETLISK